MFRHGSSRLGFTLIELLAVISANAGGVNVSYLDGHVGRVYQQPKDRYR